MRKIVSIAVGFALAVGLLAATESTATADSVCTLHLTAPSTVVVGSAYNQLKFSMTSNCSYNYAKVRWLTGDGSDYDTVDSLQFTPSNSSITDLYEAGNYRNMGKFHSQMYDSYAPGYSLQINTAFITVKYSSLTYFTPTRKGSAVYVNILSKQYVPSAAGYGTSPNRLVYLQRYINGGWQTMLGHITDDNGANTFGFIQAKAYSYRVVTAESADAWSRTGGAATK